MGQPKVHISVTFVPVKNTSKPGLMIQNPTDITNLIGKFELKKFDQLKDALREIIDDCTYGLFFHHDDRHIYNFDERPFQNGAIYGRMQEKVQGEVAGTKITASRLVPLQTKTIFETHVKEIGEAIYKRGNRKRIDYYKVELCVLVVKEKLPPLPRKRKLPTSTSIQPPATSISTITSTNSSSTVMSTIDHDTTTPNVSTEGSRKRKKTEEVHYKFKARSLSIILHAPIETMCRKNTTTTGVPSGKTNKELEYDLEHYIIGGLVDDEDSISSISTEYNDEFFKHNFTLSKFRRDLMVLALEKFPEEYALKKNL